MKIGRHAKRRMSLYNVTEADVERIATTGDDDGTDQHDNPRKIGQVDGRWIRVIIAKDDPTFIITVYERRKR